jgi:hypothetical protein
MTKLLDKLTQEVSKKTEKETDLVESAKLLLSSNEAEERKLLNNIGLNNELKHFEEKKAKITIHKDLSEKYGATIVHKNDITEFCLKYGLVVRRPSHYQGKIPLDAGIKLRAFVEANQIPVSMHSDYNQEFRVIAPPQLFGMKNPTVAAITNTIFNVVKNAENYYERKRLEDPMLVYYVGNDFYAIIHAWGEDETLKRRISGFFYNHLFNAFSWLLCLITWPILIGLATLIVGAVANFAIDKFLPVAQYIKVNDTSHFLVSVTQWLVFVAGTITYWAAYPLFAETHKVNKSYNKYGDTWTY